MIRTVLAGVALSLSCIALAQPANVPVSKGVYTGAQAARGKVTYDSVCAACHGGALAGADAAPPLAGGRFLANWSGQTAGDFAQRVRTTMPQSAPGSLRLAATADVTAYILQVNGFRPGVDELPKETSRLQQIVIDSPHDG